MRRWLWLIVLLLPTAAAAETWHEWLIRKLIELSSGWWGY